VAEYDLSEFWYLIFSWLVLPALWQLPGEVMVAGLQGLPRLTGIDEDTWPRQSRAAIQALVLADLALGLEMAKDGEERRAAKRLLRQMLAVIGEVASARDVAVILLEIWSQLQDLNREWFSLLDKHEVTPEQRATVAPRLRAQFRAVKSLLDTFVAGGKPLDDVHDDAVNPPPIAPGDPGDAPDSFLAEETIIL